MNPMNPMKTMNPKTLKSDNIYHLKILKDDQKSIAYEMITEVLSVDCANNKTVIFFNDLKEITTPNDDYPEPLVWDLEYNGLSEAEKECYRIKDLGHKSEHPEYFL